MEGTFMGGGSQPQHTQDSLPSLPGHLQSDTHLTAHLASRFHVSLPTARLSSHGLICINTYSTSTKGPNGQKEGSAMGAAEDLAHRAWTRLGARGEDQAVVFLGETGAGKTTIRSHFLSAMLAFTSTPLSAKLSYAAFVFDTLTTTKTVTTPTASKSGLFYELQYDTSTSMHPTLIGGKLLDHRLERSRIAAVPTGERSFHVLYYLLAGTSPSEKSHLGFDMPGMEALSAGNRSSIVAGQKRWRYLGHPTQLKVGINDAEGFNHFKTALRKLEFPKDDVADICQMLATVLHIGQLEFHTAKATTPSDDNSGGYGAEGGETVTAVKNRETLEIVAAFMGVSCEDLEMCLGYKTKLLNRERVTVMLDPKGARDNADELARTLYSLLVAYVFECINQRICALDDSISNTVSIVDFPGFSQNSATGCALDQLLNNAATEGLYSLALHSLFEQKAQLMETEDISVPPTSYFDNSDAVKGLLKPGNGLLAILDDQMKRGKTDLQFLESCRRRFENKNPAIEVSSSTSTLPGSNFPTYNTKASFTVKHFAGEVEYPVSGLIEENSEVVSGDLMNLASSTRSPFVRALFKQEALHTTYHPMEKTAIMSATLSSKPTRKPSVARRAGTLNRGRSDARKFGANRDDDAGSDSGSRTRAQSRSRRGKPETAGNQGASGEFLASLDNITTSLSSPNTNSYFVFCIKPNDRRIANQFDSKCVRNQLQVFGIAEMSQRLRNADFSVFLPFGEFVGLAGSENNFIGSEKEKAESILDEKAWSTSEARVGSTGVLLSERCWAALARVSHSDVPSRRLTGDMDGESIMNDFGGAGHRSGPSDSKVNLLGTPSPNYHDDKTGAYFDTKEIDLRSDAGVSAFNSGDMFRNHETREQMAEKGNDKELVEVDDVVTSGSRKRWLFIVYLLTFFIPDFVIKMFTRIKRKDVRTAWREKLAINMLIWISCGFVVFFIVIFPELICPRQLVFSQAELSAYNGKNGMEAYTSIRGVVFDLGNFIPSHYPNIIPDEELLKWAGKDATGIFPVQVSAVCPGMDAKGIDDRISFDYQSTNYTDINPTSMQAIYLNAQYHDFRWGTADPRYTWFTAQMLYLEESYFKGRIGWPPKYLKKLTEEQDKYVGYINGRVYDFTNYIAGPAPLLCPLDKQNCETSDPSVNTDYMYQPLVELFQRYSGTDLSQRWNELIMSDDVRARMQICLDNLFYIGDLDTRASTQCLFARYILLAISVLLASVIGFKFLAALQFGRKNIPENLDKFVICTIPAYTEDEESLRRAIDSAARMRYDDKRKLLVIICDGMIIGQGNDRPTPRIVLDILGVPETVDPEPLSFESLGEGLKQHNMGKVYSGLYEVQGHIVPFLVIVKIGKPSEVSRPGNRGKRDSQMILMRFLNRVHYNMPMTPLELEMHHQIRNIIGVNPTFYEFLLQIDADTIVAPDSATRMISAFLHDTRLIGVCGETALTNAKSSFVTMMQVYEYYISHNLTKAFESLFGSVTCLPGCFSMYRIRAAETGKPLFVSREIVENYAEIRVDTLHMKNLLHLGEDRYLTTLLMKHHAKYKTKYIFRAHAWTIAPDSWKVFMSQRRRWINSTVHNLMELIPLTQLCGFCCFSMRFIVFLDLLSTIVQPVIIGYIVYLIVLLARDSSVVPITAFILLGAIYGLQAIIFILRRKWEMIGWMIIYVIATPVFACGLPLYAFWHMDDFTWGNTRVVTGEKGRQIVISDEGKFDPKSIPRKRWEEYQAELWEAQTHRDETEADARSMMSGMSYGTKPGGSVFGVGAATIRSDYPKSDFGYIAGYQPPSRAMSATPSRMEPPPRYPSSNMGLPHIGGASPQPGGYEMSDFNGSVMGMSMHGPGQPSDDQLLAEIRDILSTADLMTVTKKSVLRDLEGRFGVSLEARKMYIGSATEAILGGQL